MEITIRPAKPSDAAVWESMRRELWPDGAEDHDPEIAMFFAGHHFNDLMAVLIAENLAGEIVAFAELSVRDDVPGLQGTRTAYVEAMYVLPKVRFRGVGRKLLQASQKWAREQQCEAFASDRADRIVIDPFFAARSGRNSNRAARRTGQQSL